MNNFANEIIEQERIGMTPEKRLIYAILQNAVVDFIYGKKKSYESAEEWLFSDDNTHLFSLDYVCDVLELHKDDVRKSVMRFKENEAHRTRKRYSRQQIAA